jgi:hypothetical protein
MKFNHSHKIIKITGHTKDTHGWYAYMIEMDCPVQPAKCIVTSCELKEGEEFDPHFSNTNVIARFRPDGVGYQNAVLFLRS